ncbi:MAG: hypothetical protein HC890_01335 [Chloroflexaceae bacterium]|nr:hypothetical protein [Chloroflexaceae bacterium]
MQPKAIALFLTLLLGATVMGACNTATDTETAPGTETPTETVPDTGAEGVTPDAEPGEEVPPETEVPGGTGQ